MAAGRGIIESVADLRILYPIPDFALKYSAFPLKPDRTAIATGVYLQKPCRKGGLDQEM